MLPGGDIQARDSGRSMTPREWALFTGRYETANLMYRLMSKPCAEQFCDSFSPEWPMLEVNKFIMTTILLLNAPHNAFYPPVRNSIQGFKLCFFKVIPFNCNVWSRCAGAGGPGPRAKVLLEAFDQLPLLLPL